MAEKFHERFNIPVPIEEARRRFINRVQNQILSYGALAGEGKIQYCWNRSCKAVANRIGEPYRAAYDAMAIFTESWEWHKTLQAIEAVYDEYKAAVFLPFDVGQIIDSILSAAEVDLGIRWTGGRFIPAGADELDQVLINDSLRWMRDRPGLKTVIDPFSKALEHLLWSTANPNVLSDVITDAFESLEALAKIVTGKDKTLDSNRELFLSKVKASDAYKLILREYCTYAHNFWHGVADPKDKPVIDYAEAESFVYLTGLFIRLTISAGFASSAVS
jgi:hypothetical protein